MFSNSYTVSAAVTYQPGDHLASLSLSLLLSSQFLQPKNINIAIVMGNQMSFRVSDHATGKIVYWDGSVQEFDKPLTAAELMLENPQQVVVEFQSALNQKRPTPLPADEKLEMKKVYLMLPMKRGKPVRLSGEESRRMLLIMHSNKSSSKYVPWLARICHVSAMTEAVVLKKKELDHDHMGETKQERSMFSGVLPEIILEGRPDYLSRQLSGKVWKPSLDTIEEKKIESKVSHWLFLKTLEFF